VLKVKVQLKDASLQVRKARSGLELSRMSLCQLTGADLQAAISVNDSIVMDDIYSSLLKSGQASNRLEYQLLERKLRMEDMNIKLTRGEYLPTAGISVGYNYYELNLDGMDNYDSGGISAIASISIPITKFGEGSGRINSARADKKIAQLELEETERLLQLDIEQARLNLVDAGTRVNISKEAVDQADENLRVSMDSYKLGMETLVNMLEAQAYWQKAYSDYIDAKSDFKIKESYYLKITNSLNPE